jgi:two-component system NtrC family response regulator
LTEFFLQSDRHFVDTDNCRIDNMKNIEPIRVLVIDDEKSIRRLIQKEFASAHRKIETAESAQEALGMIVQKKFDVIVLDICLPDGNGIELMEKIWDDLPDAEIILITGYGDIDDAVEAMRMGVYDYITKPFNLDRLEVVIEKAYQRVRLKKENRMLKQSQHQQPVKQLIGHSGHIQHVLFLISKVAPTHVPVLITGESGSGKNVVAQSLYAQSLRNDHLLVVKNCATLESNLMRSELFGHCKGAFTGADETREGLLASANKGTLFLDEIGELLPEIQASLLRVLEYQTYRRVGEKEERKVDIRFIFATNRNLLEEVRAGRFSEALYHRLNVFNIAINPLRERKEDIPILIEYFLGNISGGGYHFRVSKKAMKCLLEYHWPGNVRELQNVIKRGVILSDNGLITERALPQELVEASSGNGFDHELLSLKKLEKQHVLRVLETVDGNRSKASKILGIDRKTLYRKLNEFQFS